MHTGRKMNHSCLQYKVEGNNHFGGCPHWGHGDRFTMD